MLVVITLKEATTVCLCPCCVGSSSKNYTFHHWPNVLEILSGMQKNPRNISNREYWGRVFFVEYYRIIDFLFTCFHSYRLAFEI